MPQTPTLRKRFSSISLTLSLQFRQSWASWLLRLSSHRLEKATLRLELLAREQDSQSLRVKELQLQQISAAHRIQEMQDSATWHRAEIQRQQWRTERNS